MVLLTEDHSRQVMIRANYATLLSRLRDYVGLYAREDVSGATCRIASSYATMDRCASAQDGFANEVIDSSPEQSPRPGDEDMSPYSCKEDEDKPGSVSAESSPPVHTSGDQSYDHPLDMTKGDGLAEPSSSTSSWSSSQPLNMTRNGDGGGGGSSNRESRRAHHSSPSSAVAQPPPSSHRHANTQQAHHAHQHPSSDAHGLQDHNYEELANGSCNDCTTTPEDLLGGVKEEDDEEDDEVDEKLDNQKFDPERLKAFNMFVRLFVDENLDRMVPISKQPKDKIQAIIDSCARQFPEFSERSRKRIRTYLKSCRRTKRCRDQNSWDLGRPTPPHLTSAMAEQILATACDNESNNAKRMRLGLEPISVCIQNDRENGERPEPTIRQPNPIRSYSSDLHRNGVTSNTSLSYRVTSTSSLSASTCNSSPKHFAAHSASLQPTPPGSQPPAKCPLNPNEASAVRQLIAGYRESAAFLVRSADELEQLLLQQN